MYKKKSFSISLSKNMYTVSSDIWLFLTREENSEEELFIYFKNLLFPAILEII